jgi:hypothetical protein
MKEAESYKPSGRLGFYGLFVIVFIILKLVKVIDWPWVWVLSPIWIPTVLGLAISMV